MDAVSRRVGFFAASALVVANALVVAASQLVEWPAALQPLPAIAFSAETDLRQFDIAVADAGTITQLTDDKLSYAPAWAPDGSQIAFVRAKPGSFEECCGYGTARVWLMDAEGSKGRPIGPWDVAPQVGPQWMPDGESVVYTVTRPDRGGREDASSVVELEVATGAETVLVEDYPGYAFALSSDGTRLAVEADRGITVVALDSGSTQVIAEDVIHGFERMRWSPDDAWISGYGPEPGSGRWGLLAWNLEDERLVTVLAGSETIEDATWVAASQMVYCVTTEAELPEGETLLKGELWSALIDHDEVVRRQETQYAGDPPEGIPAWDDCVGEDMDALVVR